MASSADQTLAQETLQSFEKVHQHAVQTLTAFAANHDRPVQHSEQDIGSARSALAQTLPEQGHGAVATTDHLIDIAKGFNASSLSPHYYGFVTGGITPAARAAESLVSLYDQNVQVHLPGDTIATNVEHRALSMLAELFGLPGDDGSGGSTEWRLKTLTTGATGGNILGLISAREHFAKVREHGLLQAYGRDHGIQDVQVLTTLAHSSLIKAASIAGFGARNVVDVAAADGISFDYDKLSAELAKPNYKSVVVISCGEVNTGAFATHSASEMKRLRDICDAHGAWLHVDGAFGLFASLLPDEPQYQHVRSGAEGMAYADSIGGDAHKMLNVPYDCGFFFARSPEPTYNAFQAGNAPYLTSGTTSSGADTPWLSPLHIGLENSRRFRALPVYATLKAYGRQGYADIVARCVDLARAVSRWIVQSRGYELLPHGREHSYADDTFTVVLFRARSRALNAQLIRRINATRAIYLTATQWAGEGASRLAVSNWQVDVRRDEVHVTKVLADVYSAWTEEHGDEK